MHKTHVHPDRFMNLTYYNLSIVGDVRAARDNKFSHMQCIKCKQEKIYRLASPIPEAEHICIRMENWIRDENGDDFVDDIRM